MSDSTTATVVPGAAIPVETSESMITTPNSHRKTTSMPGLESKRCHGVPGNVVEDPFGKQTDIYIRLTAFVLSWSQLLGRVKVYTKNAAEAPQAGLVPAVAPATVGMVARLNRWGGDPSLPSARCICLPRKKYVIGEPIPP